MDTEKIVEELNRRFAEPLPEFYKRRVIVWHDAEQEFFDKITEISLANAKIAILTGKNNFTIKKLICADDVSSNYLLYSPLTYESLEDNWLLDIEFYSEKFSADIISMWLEEMKLPQTADFRKAVKLHKKFMQSKERRNKISMQKKLPSSAEEIELAVMAALCGVNDATPTKIIKSVLCENKILQDFTNYEVEKEFWRIVKDFTGYKGNDIGKLATHIFLTALTRTVDKSFFFGQLEKFISPEHQDYCYNFLSDWISEKNIALKKIAECVESQTKLHQRLVNLTVDELVEIEIFPCVNEIILAKLMKAIKDNVADSTAIKTAVEKRRAFAWYDDFKVFFEGLFQVANVLEFDKNHSEGFHKIKPQEIWQEYITDLYKMDSYYRLFHKSYAESLQSYHENLSDIFSDVKDIVENLYVNKFLEEVGLQWSNAVEEQLQTHGRILDLPLQTDFYKSYVKKAESKIYVIVSDALRYEVAAELATELRRETQCKIKLNAVQGIFPTITKFGMAALLPHENLFVKFKNEKLSVLADGESTDSTNRDKILKSANTKSVALKYKDIINLQRAERGALVKGMEVVYIYHDKIDEVGHGDGAIFSACAEAVKEIKNIVRIITNEFGGTNILITADHGFLYTYNPLTEIDKVGKISAGENEVEISRRYAITKKDTVSEYLMPVKFLDGEEKFFAFTPRGSIRIKVKSSAGNFVHGGVSLQEIVVPVIEYHFLRNDSKEYLNNKEKYDKKFVTINLLSSSRKISNVTFSLDFYQKEAVQDNFSPATYQAYFADSAGKKISNIVCIIADKIEKDITARTFRVRFNLKMLEYKSTEIYYLVIADDKGQIVSREKFKIEIAMNV